MNTNGYEYAWVVWIFYSMCAHMTCHIHRLMAYACLHALMLRACIPTQTVRVRVRIDAITRQVLMLACVAVSAHNCTLHVRCAGELMPPNLSANLCPIDHSLVNCICCDFWW